MKLYRLAARGAAVAALLVVPASARTADDWDLREDPGRELALATLEYQDAPVLAVRCARGELSLMVARLQPRQGTTRDLELTVGGHAGSGAWAAVGDGAVAARTVSGMAVRELAAGGEVSLTVRDSAPPRRYRFQAPAASAALGRVLTACGQPVAYGRDAERASLRNAGWDIDALPAWETPPGPGFPSRAFTRGVRLGRADLTCRLQPDRSLGECEVEGEYPAGLGFGEEALTAAADARVEASERTAALTGRLITFTTTFQLQ